MGYNAIVLCNCFKEGRTTVPPYKEFLKENDEGIHLDLEIFYENDSDEYYKRHKEFDEWIRTACPHENMKFASERLANISGMGAFKIILKKLGGEQRFPILSRYLPVANNGTLPTNFAEQALKELKDLENEKLGEDKVVLRVKETGETKQTVNESHQHIFVLTAFNKVNYGIDKEGFFILENQRFFWKDKWKLVFRSNDFKQIAIGNTQYRFVDNASGQQYTGTNKIHPDGPEEPEIDFEFIVERQNVPLIAEYNYIIEPLKRLMNASIEMGNPVIWT